MTDRKEVIRKFQDALEKAEKDGYLYAEIRMTKPIVCNVINMLKEQKKTPFTCSMCSKHTENGLCSRFKTNVKDDDYCSFGEGW